jgi:hypothetical protein
MRLRRRGHVNEYAKQGKPFVDAILGDRGLELANPLATEGGKHLLEQSPEVILSALFAAVDASEPYGNSFEIAAFRARDIASRLARRKLPFAAEHIDALVGRAFSGSEWLAGDRLRIAVAAAESFARTHGDAKPVERALRETVAWAEREQSTLFAAERSRLRTRARKLLETAPPSEIDFALFGRDDWAERARRVLEPRRREPELVKLVEHLARATQSSPSAKWRTEAAELVAAAKVGPVLEALLEEALVAKDGLRREAHFAVHEYVGEESATILRGIIVATSDLHPVWATDLLGRLADHTIQPFQPGYEQRSMKLANACIRALGELADDSAVARLTELRARTKHKSIVKQLDAALETAAAAKGITKSELVERQVPTFGLDNEGRREVLLGDTTAVIEHGELTWRNADGGTLKSVPARMRSEHEEDVKALRAEAKEIKRRLAVERLRIESLFAEERRWPVDEWTTYYGDHPVVGAIASRLLWRFSAEGRSEVALGSDLGDWAREVELWHPVHATPGEVQSLRRKLVERQIIQPFKQAFREIYLVAPAELETRTYSNRFAAHILRYPQAYALIKQRGWGVVALGPYDNDGGRQWRDFERHEIRAHFWMEHTSEDWNVDALLAPLAATDQVRFTRIGEDEPLPLAEIPPIVFTEAMRDVDLFVGVTSIAGDPAWVDHGDDRHLAYWRETSFGELGETAAMRREALEELVPQLAISDRCELDGRFLRVRGSRRTYKIHIGSANVLMEPDDQYLCIVRGSRDPARDLYLPFVDDRLAMILSKADLLAHDDKIKDSTIVEQIDRGGLRL